MNELVTPERGVLVAPERRAPMRSGTKFFVAVEALEAAIDGLLRASAEERLALGHAGRRWYEDNDRFFTRALGEALTLIPKHERPRP